MDDLSKVIGRLDKIEAALSKIAAALTMQTLPQEPNYVRPLGAFPGFDWSTIGAEPVEFDKSGATIVRFAGYEWTRKLSENKFGKAIIFSRTVGKDEYLTLVKFRTGGDIDEVGFELPAASSRPALPPAATVGQEAPKPTTQPDLFLWEMRRELKIDDPEIKRRLKAANVTGFPSATDPAAYERLKNILRHPQQAMTHCPRCGKKSMRLTMVDGQPAHYCNNCGHDSGYDGAVALSKNFIRYNLAKRPGGDKGNVFYPIHGDLSQELHGRIGGGPGRPAVPVGRKVDEWQPVFNGPIR